MPRDSDVKQQRSKTLTEGVKMDFTDRDSFARMYENPIQSQIKIVSLISSMLNLLYKLITSKKKKRMSESQIQSQIKIE